MDRNKKEKLQIRTWMTCFARLLQERFPIVVKQKTFWIALLVILALFTHETMKTANAFGGLGFPLAMVLCGMHLVWAGALVVAAIAFSRDFFVMLRCADDFLRAGFCNKAGEPPILIFRTQQNSIMRYVFFVKGLAHSDWEERKNKIETALNIIILAFEEAEDKQHMVVRCVSGKSALPSVIEWPGIPESAKETEILIGQGFVQPVEINLADHPHWLIGGATGCGKSRLLAGMILQMLLKGYSVFLIDAKDGMDYSFARNHVSIAFETDEIVDNLEKLITTMYDRREILKQANVHNIDEYNKKFPQHRMHRICLVIDEASSVFDAQAASKDEKATIQKITHDITHIGRLARFVGIHLMIATQRPDVNSVPGAVKANLTGRIAGHCSDDQASITILDDGSATEIPAHPGRFLVRDGSMNDSMVQAYLLDEEKIDVELKKHFLKNTFNIH